MINVHQQSRTDLELTESKNGGLSTLRKSKTASISCVKKSAPSAQYSRLESPEKCRYSPASLLTFFCGIIALVIFALRYLLGRRR